MKITYTDTVFDDADDLVEIRISAMRESLEQIGRFDPLRARERFIVSFVPESTKYVFFDAVKVGFVVVKFTATEMLLDHLYIRLEYQGKGIGTAVLQKVFAEADSRCLPLRVGALRESRSNHFYQQHGFIKSSESEWDIYYIRQPNTKP